jgi:hypothetical protein
MMEALVCHPLGESFFPRDLYEAKDIGLTRNADTIKVRMQLSRRARAPGVRSDLSLTFGYCTNKVSIRVLEPRIGRKLTEETPRHQSVVSSRPVLRS